MDQFRTNRKQLAHGKFISKMYILKSITNLLATTYNDFPPSNHSRSSTQLRKLCDFSGAHDSGKAIEGKQNNVEGVISKTRK